MYRKPAQTKCQASGVDDGSLMAFFVHLLLNFGLLSIKPGV
jgi:hypothetical protein